MASEIRVNKINNRAGLGTITIADTGVVVNGIVTCTEVSGLNVLNIAGVSTFASTLDINGDIDVDGHTNLDNISVAGVSTFTNIVNVGNNIQLNSSSGAITVGSGVTIESNGQATFTGIVTFGSGSTTIDNNVVNVGTALTLGHTQGVQFHTQNLHSQGFEVNQINASGIVTASSFRGDGSQLTGVTSVGGNTGVDFNDNIKVRLGTGNDLEIYYDGTDGWIKNVGKLKLESTNDEIQLRADIIYLRNKAANQNYFYGVNNAFVGLTYAGDMRLETESTGIKFRKRLDPETDSTVDLGTNAKRWRNIYADTYYGDGANLTNLPAGAPVGGASTNTVFFENDVAVAVNYQITTNKNAMSAGPIAINAGIAVTVPSGSAWTIV